MKINFYLPQIYRGVAGGYNVIYQYSNFLIKNNHEVNIYYSLNNGKNNKHIPKFLCILIRKLYFIKYPKWYKLNPKIKQYAIKNIENKYVEDADISIATAPKTAYEVNLLDNSKGKKFYLIQGYENWDGSSAKYLHESYALNMKNIVISKWLKNIVDKYSNNKSLYLPNGINLSKFKIYNPIEKRNNHSIAMVYNLGENKGCIYALKVFKKLKRQYHDLSIQLYGSPKRTLDIPNWIKYKRCANNDEVVKYLNENAIFVCSSIFEGFGLPGLEAMACGCALVTTECKGPREYANDQNAIFVNSKNENELYFGLKELLDNPKKRINIAKKGFLNAQKWNIDLSNEKFLGNIISMVENE